MSTEINQDQDALHVAFCDLGLGIPRTLGEHCDEEDSRLIASAKDKVLSLFGLKIHHDGTIIHSAIEFSRSRTGEDYRGRGLGKMASVIEAVGGRLMIFSNAGGLDWQIKNGKGDPNTVRYSESIYGTLIGWKLKLNEVANDDES
jgi:hypothetical protein